MTKMNIVWEGVLEDVCGDDAQLRVRIDEDGDVCPEEFYEDHRDGPGWYICEDDTLTMDALAQAVLAARGRS